MLSKKLSRISVFAGTIAVSLWAWLPAANSGSPSAHAMRTAYLPIRSISHNFGSKFVSGYFVQQAASCVVTLMVTEGNDPEAPQPLSPTRVRLMLSPGQIAGLDSEEGRSLNITCGEGGATLFVDVGEREKLVAQQQIALQKAAAELQSVANVP